MRGVLSHRWLLGRGVARVAYMLIFSAGLNLASLAQSNNPYVSANVDDLATGAQRRPLTPYSQIPVSPAPEDFEKSVVGPGTLLSMDVYNTPELSGLTLRVDAEGDVSVPTLGTVHVAGITLPEAQRAMEKALVDGEILVAPNVRLTVVQYPAAYVSVLGEVQNPGRYLLIAPRSLSDVLGLAGGETVAASDEVEIQHPAAAAKGGANSQHVHYTQRDSIAGLANIAVKPGDLVVVHRAGVAYVLGAVNRPGGYLMANGGKLDVFQALSMAGGTTLDAARNGMYIIRPHDEVFETIKVPFSNLRKQRQETIQLQRNDVLYIPRSGWKVTLLDGSAIIGAAVNAAVYNAH